MMGTCGKINAIWWNIKINLQKLVHICGYELPTNLQNFSQKDLTEVKIFQKVLGGATFFEISCMLHLTAGYSRVSCHVFAIVVSIFAMIILSVSVHTTVVCTCLIYFSYLYYEDVCAELFCFVQHKFYVIYFILETASLTHHSFINSVSRP